MTDDTTGEVYEGGTFAQILDEVEVQQSSEESALPADEVQDTASSAVAESMEDFELPVSVSDVPGTSASLDAERVQAIFDAFMESDQVNALIRTFEDTMESVSYALETSQEEPEDRLAPLEVVSVEEVLERMTPQATQEQTVQSVSGLARSAPASVPAAVSGGEVLVPVADEITLVEVAELVQTLLSYFQEDDNDLLTAIRDNTAETKAKVIEIAENTAARPLMETPFEEYSVLEGLLLLLMLWLMFINPCIRMIKGGFSWLAW